MKEKAVRSRYCFVVLYSGLSDPGQVEDQGPKYSGIFLRDFL